MSGEIGAWLSMGGYGAYVWAAYAAAALLLIGLVVASLRALRRAEAELAASDRGGRRLPPGGRA